MKERLLELLKKAHSPYYKFNVSAIVVTKDGNKFEGVNVESSSQGAGVCAERVAIYQAVTQGYKKGDFKELHVMGSGEKSSAPCFICRQTLVDFFDEDVLVYLYTKERFERSLTVKNLTPYSYGEGDMK